ncbi:hypothetical protein CS238_22155 [Salmonella enterica]|nr:hypothetical protein [Salmonella enterica]EJC8750118.1 hypothetical protein [Salmonella enterica]HCM1652038.1 hypothetical protein [Salmonella enterica subsp. diarizonae serovar 48:i:z35]
MNISASVSHTVASQSLRLALTQSAYPAASPYTLKRLMSRKADRSKGNPEQTIQKNVVQVWKLFQQVL